MKHPAHLSLSATLIILCAAIPASADPVTVTGGFLLSTGVHETSPRSVLTGTEGFSASGHVVIGVGAGRMDAFECRFNPLDCLPGQAVSLFGHLSATGHGDPGFADAVVTHRGVEYRDFESADAEHGFLLDLDGSVTLPAFTNGATTVTAPFVLGGRLFGFEGDIATLTGSGIATLWLAPAAFDGMPYWTVQQIRYDMLDPAPIPEPATLLLVGSGLGMIVRASRRRRRLVP